MRDQGEEREERQRVDPPVGFPRGRPFGERKLSKVGDHQEKDQARDDAGFTGDFPQPDRTHKEAAHKQSRNGYGDHNGKQCDESKIGLGSE